MRIHLGQSADRVEIACEGALDAETVAAFRPVAEAALAAPGREVALRCERLSRLDSSGIGAVVFLHRRLVQQGRRLRLVGLQGQPLALARLIRLDAALGEAPAAPARPRRGAAVQRLARLLRPAPGRPAEA